MTDNLERAKYNLSATAYAAALDEIDRLNEANAKLMVEIERLRAHAAELEAQVDTKWRHLDTVVAERDAALRERDELVRSLDTSVASLEAEHVVGILAEDRDAWRVCADQLGTSLRWMFDNWIEGGYSEVGDEPFLTAADGALAVYEALRDA